MIFIIFHTRADLDVKGKKKKPTKNTNKQIVTMVTKVNDGQKQNLPTLRPSIKDIKPTFVPLSILISSKKN